MKRRFLLMLPATVLALSMANAKERQLGGTINGSLRESATMAQALKFDVHVGDADAKLGKLKALIERLKAAGYRCAPEAYTAGVNISCNKTDAPKLLIDFNFVPTRFPEYLEINSIRANGVDGGELPKGKYVEYLNGLRKQDRP